MELRTAQRRLDGRTWTPDLPAWDSPRTLVLVFGPSSLVDDPRPLEELAQRFPTSTIAGCSTSGEIFADTVTDDSLTVAVARFATTEVRHAIARVSTAEDSAVLGRHLGRAVSGDGPPLDAMLVLSDGLGVNGSALSRGLLAAAPGVGRVTGGLAGDGNRFERTWVIGEDGRPLTGVVSVIGLTGPDLRVGTGSSGGWDPFGPERTVTRSDGNVLHELDGRPALELYRTYLGELADGLPSAGLRFPLAVREWSDGQDTWLVRTILRIDEEQQSMIFAGDLPEGATARLMRSSLGRLVDGAEAAARAAAPECVDGGPVLALAVSCVGRRLVMGRRTEDELEAVASTLPAGSDVVGFYSYGELSPSVSGPCALHNQTMTVTTIAEHPR